MEKNFDITKRIIDKIIEHDKIILLRHILPDGDAYGFQFGLKKLINLNWPNKLVLVGGLQYSQDMEYIAKAEDFDTLTKEDFEQSLVIIGDTANKARIDINDNLFEHSKYLIKFDHHPNREEYGDLMYIREDYPACCQMLTEFIIENNLKIDAQIARVIFHGIVSDTNRFLLRYPSPKTFNLAAFLLEQGFDLTELYETMYARTRSDINFISYVYSNYKVSKNGVAYIKLTQKDLQDLNVKTFHAAYNHVILLANIKECPMWVMFCEYEDGIIQGELRSQKIPINDIAIKYGGGGHKSSSGVRVKNFETTDAIIEDMDKLLEENFNGQKVG